MAELQKEGKVRHIGLSEVVVEQLERARAVAPIATVQNRYNVADREHEPVLEYCEAHGIGFIPWFPLGSGSLCAGDGPLGEIAARHRVSPSQVAIAWGQLPYIASHSSMRPTASFTEYYLPFNEKLVEVFGPGQRTEDCLGAETWQNSTSSCASHLTTVPMLKAWSASKAVFAIAALSRWPWKFREPST